MTPNRVVECPRRLIMNIPKERNCVLIGSFLFYGVKIALAVECVERGRKEATKIWSSRHLIGGLGKLGGVEFGRPLENCLRVHNPRLTER